MADRGFPRWAWRASVGALAASAALVAALLVLSALGAGERKPVGTLTLDRTPGEVVFVEDPGTRAFTPLDAAFQLPGSAELALTLDGGPAETGYGLWWASGGGARLVVAITGTGYYGVFLSSGRRVEALDDWRPYPNVRPPGEPNRIRLDVRGSILEVRVNDELAGAYPFRGQAGAVGVFVESFEEGGAAVTPARLRLWALYPEP